METGELPLPRTMSLHAHVMSLWLSRPQRGQGCMTARCASPARHARTPLGPLYRPILHLVRTEPAAFAHLNIQFGRSRRLWGGGHSRCTARRTGRGWRRVFSSELLRRTNRTAGRSGARHLRTSPRKSPPASSLACAAHPRLVPVRGARISRCLPARLRRSRPRHAYVPSRTRSFVPGSLRSATRPDPFGWGVRLRSALTSVCSRQDHARYPPRAGTSPGSSAIFWFWTTCSCTPPCCIYSPSVSTRSGTVVRARSVM